MASIDDKNLVQVSGTVPAASPQIQQTTTTGASEAPLFEGTSSTEGVSTTDRTDAYIPSTGGASGVEKSNEMSALEIKLSEKQSVVADIDAEIEANDALKEEKKAAYTTAGELVTTTLAAYNTAARNYTAAVAELEELKSGNFLESILNTITLKISQAEKKVAQLKATAEQAREDYENALEERQNAREEYTDAIQEGITLKQDRTAAQQEVAAVQKEIQDLQQKEAEEQTTTDNSNTGDTPADGANGTNQNTCSSGLDALKEAAKTNPELQAAIDLYGDEITEADIEELSLKFNVQTGETANNADNGANLSGADKTGETSTAGSNNIADNSLEADKALLEDVWNDAEEEAEIFKNTPDVTEMQPEDVQKFVEIFCEGLTHDEIRGLGMNMLDIVDEATKIFETKLAATAYSKSGAMATSDSATTEEHSKAQSDFTEAVLQVSDIVNNTDVEFYNVSDKSNFELASRTLDRINEGEYIKTDTLEKQTSIVKNIRVTEKTTTEAVSSNDEKYKQYSDAILGELHELVGNSENGISEEEYNSIKTNFDLKASQNMESAFDYLENEARKHNITSAISEFDS